MPCPPSSLCWPCADSLASSPRLTGATRRRVQPAPPPGSGSGCNRFSSRTGSVTSIKPCSPTCPPVRASPGGRLTGPPSAGPAGEVPPSLPTQPRTAQKEVYHPHSTSGLPGESESIAVSPSPVSPPPSHRAANSNPPWCGIAACRGVSLVSPGEK